MEKYTNAFKKGDPEGIASALIKHKEGKLASEAIAKLFESAKANKS